MLGQSATIYTNHMPLTYLYSQLTVNSCQLRYLQELAEFSVKIVYFPGLRYSGSDALSRQPCEAGQPDDDDIGDFGGGPYALQDPIIFAAVEVWLKVVDPTQA